ncbi:MAG TPA: MFS transporter [Stellaceae bacterium]|nr:MFS transporter [Stellaceae bacterium]
MPASVRLAFFYIAMFLLSGVQLPFWPAWLAGRGLSAGEIGTLLALCQWIKLAANPLAGIAADRSAAPRRIMLALSLGAMAGFALLLPARGFALLLLTGTLATACVSALLPLGDHLALALAYGGRLDYGRIRLWGSLSFILATLLAGRLIAARGAEMVAPLLLGAATLIAAACAGLPAGDGDGPAQHPPSWRNLARPSFLAFLTAAALIQGSHAVFYGFGTLHWQRLGIADDAIALLWSEGVVAEILLFYWGAPLLRRLGPRGLMALGGGAGVLRWTLTGFAAGVPALALLQLLHGLTFGAAHLGAMHHLARSVPAGQAATAQALYATVVGGIGQGLLLLLAGLLYGALGGRAFLAMAAVAAAGAGLALLGATKS